VLDAKSKKIKRDDGEQIEVREISKVELFEVSLVTVPANRESVISAKSYLAELHGEEVACSLVSLADDSGDVETFTMHDEEIEDEEHEEKNDEPTIELVSLKDRQPDQNLELVSLKETKNDE
jgi:hypothetical protein